VKSWKWRDALWVIAIFAASAQAASAQAPAPTADNANRFGIASSAEWSKEYPRFEPLIHDAGAGWLRWFPEWHSLQPKKGEWNWKACDEFVAASRSNHVQLTGLFYYFAPWASSGGDSRTFPLKDMQDWRDYVGGLVSHYHKDIKYWEVWNEPQAFQKKGKPEYYADMVREAHDAAKRAHPEAQIGLTAANFAVSYLQQVIKAGAADHFDYLCVHPYENMEQLTRPGGEVNFLSMADNLRRMLAANKQRRDLPLWITEIGWKAPVQPDAAKDALQAELLTKVFVLSFAQGFQRVFWFEARGPAYGKGTDFGVIRSDWTSRPSYSSLKATTAALGETPRYLGWLDFEGSYGFVFEGHRGPVLAAWSPVGKKQKVSFTTAAEVIDLGGGKPTQYAPGEGITLTNSPIFVMALPEKLVESAKGNQSKPFPWGGDFTAKDTIRFRPGANDRAEGLMLVGAPEGKEPYLALKKKGSVSFRANPSFAPFGTTDLEIKVVARSRAGGKAGMQLFYETQQTVSGYGRAGWRNIAAGDDWQEFTWRIADANFVGTWGYNFALTEAADDISVKEVVVKKLAPAKP
jgi:polysaccharide biosynthesis protein PslG